MKAKFTKEELAKVKVEPMYCPKCYSRLYLIDVDYMVEFGVCSYCVTYSERRNIKNGLYSN